jgi:hypothetical protein
MDRAESRPPRSRASRAKWIVGTSAVAASVVLTGVVAAAGSGADDPDPDPDVPTTTVDTYVPPAWPPPGAPSLGDTGVGWPRDPYQDTDADDDDWSNGDGGGDLAPAIPSPAPDTSSHGS